MAAQNTLFVTVRRKSPNAGVDLTIPERRLVQVSNIKTSPLTNTKRGGSVLKLLDGKKFEIYETVSQFNTTVEPTNTNITPDYATVASAGTVQGDAAAMTKYWNKVTGADGTKGVILLATASLSVQVVENAGTGILKVYPGTGDLIKNKSGVAGAINASISIPAGETWHFVKSPSAALTVLTAKDVNS